jgi:hypothetical protein
MCFVIRDFWRKRFLLHLVCTYHLYFWIFRRQ